MEKEYRKVIEFSYNNQIIVMFLDNNNKHYFLKKDNNNNYFYLNDQELLDMVSIFHRFPNVMNAEGKRKSKIIPKVIIGTVAVPITALTMLTSISMYNSHQRLKEFQQSIESSTDEEEEITYDDISEYLSFSDIEDREELVVDTYLESDWLDYLYIYDMDYLDKAFASEEVTVDDLKEVIKNNSKISDNFKQLLYEYCDALFANYSDIELRVFKENLKTLEVIECSKEELLQASLSYDSYGCYIRTENKIYVLEGYEFEKGTWAYQVMFHEFSHCLRTGRYTIDDDEVHVQIEGQNFSNTITAEALNSLFAVSLFDYEERDVAYQLQSNIHGIFIECMDNYTLSDYVNHSISYYASKLDEYNHDDNYATVILEMIQIQYNDYHSDRINIQQSEYYPIYDYICKMYFGKYLTADMTYDDAVALADTLVDRVTFDVPEEYNIDVNYFYQVLDEYCNNLGIEVSRGLAK